ncbi:2'-5' RNA ligase family protein [Bacillus aquiflavi]|uniref:Putative phosphoesterase G4D64_04380 n=1 Tax=Bacillus aquiflavi TaxID=2672567 RepID=A0A6B3VYG2_9BACI|nr:YjcG family protein [Bacillus aquiflavi]MBA4536405.1 2'-5' RNA ligase family protein [Bacillus aquiflavi]NEY80773.1 hypothetical protein [Bacillus aquiflavi]UAC49135.1 YjcG family protein [Bacillus aquiflavi]
MKLGIVIFPSKKLQDFANSYRKRYDPHYALIPPHITLKAPFEATEEQAKELADKLLKFGEEHKPFSLNAYKISSFQPVNNVIYIKINHSDELESLHEDLHRFTDSTPEYAFIPHITIGQNLSNDEHSDIYGQLKMVKVNVEEEIVDRFHLLYQLENGSWTVYETIRLGKEEK